MNIACCRPFVLRDVSVTLTDGARRRLRFHANSDKSEDNRRSWAAASLQAVEPGSASLSGYTFYV